MLGQVHRVNLAGDMTGKLARMTTTCCKCRCAVMTSSRSDYIPNPGALEGSILQKRVLGANCHDPSNLYIVEITVTSSARLLTNVSGCLRQVTVHVVLDR